MSPNLSFKIDKTYGLLQSLCASVTQNVRKRLEIVEEIFEIISHDLQLSEQIRNLIQIADNEIKQDIEMNEKVASIFSVYVDQLVDFQRRKEGLPSDMRMKQIKSGWSWKIELLHSCRETLDLLFDQRDDLVLKAIRVNTILKGLDQILELA